MILKAGRRQYDIVAIRNTDNERLNKYRDPSDPDTLFVWALFLQVVISRIRD